MRYIIGIDLGTTNSALAFIDTEQPPFSLQLFAIPQFTATGRVDSLLALPSFCYLIAPNEWSSSSLQLPWKEETTTFVGQFAKNHGARVPTRLVKSAKSWLCNAAANRRDKILPLESADLSHRLSPVEASSKYLIHLRDAWNATMAKGNSLHALEEQEIILTVPASFDEIARSLTVEAARAAGFLHITLIEEPQAAFYSWISHHENDWKTLFKPGDSIVVCDVGGGTTDFSLIEIQESEGELSFQRMAVGNHLLLGGDNMDIALAHYVEQKLQQTGCPSLEGSQWLQLEAEVRSAKESLLKLDEQSEEVKSIVLQGTGSSVLKGSLTSTLSRKEVEELLLTGFFGMSSLEDALHFQQTRGFRTMGLPYEDEPSVIKHLAHFLKQAGRLEKGVEYILFNGGTLKPSIFRQAIEQTLKKWFPTIFLAPLGNTNLDFAVARGAAYYGKARRGLGILIGGGLPRTYYLAIDVADAAQKTTTQALTVLPKGSREGRVYQSEQIFSLRANTPVVFHLLTSHVRLHDQEGEIIAIDPLEMQFLPPIQTILRFGQKLSAAQAGVLLPVRLGIRYTPMGTVEMWLESQKSEHIWALEFQLRSATGQDPTFFEAPSSSNNEIFEKGYLEEVKNEIELLFKRGVDYSPNRIMETVEEKIGMMRKDWGPSLLRELWAPLQNIASHRKVSVTHEARWWNLAGFFLRPGLGVPLDDFRVKELWKIILSDAKNLKSNDVLLQQWICFRRIAGGLNKGQQMQLTSELIESIIEKKTGKISDKRKNEMYIYSEKIRTLASFERMDLSVKIRLGNALVDRILHSSPEKYDFWALGRIGARRLLYGSAGQVVPREICTRWVESLLDYKAFDCEEEFIFLLRQLAQKTSHRELNLSESIHHKILTLYPDAHLEEWLLHDHVLTVTERERVFGEQLPAGIILDTTP